jgi:ribonuclease III
MPRRPRPRSRSRKAAAFRVGTGESELEAVIGHRFTRPSLLQQALTHSSHCAEGGPGEATADNEKLEFLGDAILSLIASEYLLQTFPEWKEGRLSMGRASLVNGNSLCAAARRLGLGQHLRLGRGEEKTGGREKPALLADAYEAIISAIYLDAGLGPTREFIKRTLLEPAAEELAGKLSQQDHKSALQEFLQRRGAPPAEYRVASESGPDHRKTFVVELSVEGEVRATGSGSSKKEAEQTAARETLEKFTSEKE